MIIRACYTWQYKPGTHYNLWSLLAIFVASLQYIYIYIYIASLVGTTLGSGCWGLQQRRGAPRTGTPDS